MVAFLANLRKIFRRSVSQTDAFGAHFNFNLVFGGVLILVVLAEIYMGYNSLYQNLIFNDLAQSVRATNVTRINMENYNLVKTRLDAVRDYYATSSIDFLSEQPGVGRANPFADPQ